MQFEFVRTLTATLALGLLVACGSNSGGSGGGKQPPPPGNGILNVNISGLPAGVAAAVKVTGPNSYARDLAGTTSLTALSAGTYTIAASAVASGTTSYAPAAASQTANIANDSTVPITVTYNTSTISLALREVATVPDAVFLTSPTGDSRQFVVDRRGRIRVIQDGNLLPTPFLDITARVAMTGEGGLLSMAFHPQYATNGFFFIYYTDASNNIIVERRKVSGNANLADNGAVLEIIRIPHPNFTNHYGGLVAFGTDGFLYLGTGDGGGAGDPPRNGQNLNSLLGKMLRLDVNNSGSGQAYTVPATNPYVNQSGKRGEIWAAGLRNPWRFAFDASGLYIADVGQARIEEVNIAGLDKSGLNYGWNAMEGSTCYTSGCNQSGLTLPAFEYEHGAGNVNGCSITGGYVYRGKALPELAGRYFYSDFCGGYLKSFQYSANTVADKVDWAIPDIGNVQSFGRDADGELYLIAEGGKVFKIIRGTKS